MLLSLLSRFADIDSVKPLFRLIWVQRFTRFLFGWVRFKAKVPRYDFTLTIDVFNVRVLSEIRKDGAYEVALSRLFASRLKPGMTVIDIGANIGYYSLLASRIVGESGHVLAVEPDPVCLNIMRRNCSENSATNVEIVPMCLGEKEGPITLYRTYSTGFNSVIRKNVLFDSEAFAAQATTLDHLAAGKSLNIDVVKMDVQGAELFILRGAEKMLKNPSIELFIEFWPFGLRNAGERPKELLLFLLERSFSIETIEFPSRISNEEEIHSLVERVEAMERGYPPQGYVNLHAYRRSSRFH